MHRLKTFKKLIESLRKRLSNNANKSFVDYFAQKFGNDAHQIYIVDSDFNLIWANQSFDKINHSESGKCFQILFSKDNQCLNCPLIANSNSNNFVSSSYIYNGRVDSVSIPFNNKTFFVNQFTPSSQIINQNSTEISETQPDPLQNYSLQLRNLLDSITIPTVLLQPNLTIEFPNNSATELLNIDKNVAKNKLIFEILPLPADSSPENALAMIHRHKEFSYSVENWTSFRGKNLGLKITINSYNNESGGFLLATILEFEHENKIILQNEFDYLKFFFEEIPYGLIIFDSFERLVYFNNYAKRTFNLRDDFINKTIEELGLGQFYDLIFSRKTNQYLEHLTDDNKLFYFNYKISKFINPFTQVQNYAVLLIDVTEQVQNEQTISATLERINLFSDKFEGLILRLKPSLEISEVMGGVEKYLGISAKDINSLDISWLELIHPDDLFNVKQIFDEAIHFPNFFKVFEHRLLSKAGKVHWVETHLWNRTDERGKIIWLEGILYNITETKEFEEKLRSSQEEFRNLALYFETLREEEKKNLAFEIHDELGHLLTGMKLELSYLLKKKHLREEVLHEKIHKTIELIDTTIKKIRSISSQLRPSVLDHFGILAAIEWQASEFQKQTAIRCRLSLPKEEINLDEKRSIAVYRIFQEILTNIARHANATRVDVNLEIHGKELVLTVTDNGRGIKPEEINRKNSLGITSMRLRANAVNGKINIQGISNVGTIVTLSLPIE